MKMMSPIKPMPNLPMSQTPVGPVAPGSKVKIKIKTPDGGKQKIKVKGPDLEAPEEAREHAVRPMGRSFSAGNRFSGGRRGGR